MEKYKEIVKKRIKLFASVTAFITGLFALNGVFHFTPTPVGNEKTSGFILGFQFGILILLNTLLIRNLSSYRSALKDNEKLKVLYIKENDERIKMIQEKIGVIGFNVAIIGLILMAITAGYFNEVVFFSLLGAVIFLVTIKACLKLYYYRKYS